MQDSIYKINRSLIQHGKYNDRIYLIKLHDKDVDSIFNVLETLAQKYLYAKIFAKVPVEYINLFLKRGFIKEAEIPKFFNGSRDCIFMSKFLSEKRQYLKDDIKNQINNILNVARKKEKLKGEPVLLKGFNLKILDHNNAEELAELYNIVFASYPFPIYNTDYIKKTMNENIIYFGIFHNSKLVAASSSEMDIVSHNVEMTDFAILPSFRGYKLSQILLFKMDQKMIEFNMKNYFTIARALSYGINITFSKMGYKFAGTLINNTNIAGNIESMNVWFKEMD